VTNDFDCVVVGAGPGGYVAAIRAAQLGLTTAIVEREPWLGGRCLHWACIPAKTVLRCADILSEIRDAEAYGIDIPAPIVRFSAIADRRREVIGSLAGGVSHLLAKNGIEVVPGKATLGTDRVIHVAERKLRAGTALILATGSVRRAPTGLLYGNRVIGTEEAWAMNELPKSLAIVGGGSSGVEIASAYARFGTDVTLFEYQGQLLPSEDAEIASIASRGLTEQGVDVHTSSVVNNVETVEDRISFVADEKAFEVDWLVLATGRRPDVEGLGLDGAGVQFDKSGYVAVDECLQTSAPGVFAIGDLVAGPALAHKASEEGIVAVETAVGNQVRPLVHSDIPRATFCTPNVASVGLTEAEARSSGYDVVIGRANYGAVGSSSIHGDRMGLAKIVGERSYGAVLGAHIVGTRATELIQQFAVTKSLEGGYLDIARMPHAHPTLSEVLLEAARSASGWQIHG
jgi:dihydrolipoamide dehydrogenase